ncbi:MAG: porin [Draconibacterium sp.]
MKLKFTVTLVCISFAVKFVSAEERDDEFKPTITSYLNVQFWNAFSESVQTTDGELAARSAFYFRRIRPGIKGEVLPRLSYNLMLTLDYLGIPENISLKGKAPGGVNVWSFCMTYKVGKSDWLNVTGGYFLPHISREATTSPWTVSSLDKAETSNYLRYFVTGKANGVAPGINIGGTGKAGKSFLTYNFAMVNRQDATSIQTEQWSPVFMGHGMITFGAPELKKYKFTFSNNQLRKQTSLSLGAGFSKQGQTDTFKSSGTYSFDLMAYFGSLKIDGEVDRLVRKTSEKYEASCLMGRMSYNIFLKKGLVLEPTVMYEHFTGDDTGAYFDGKDSRLDLGINLISIVRKVKLNLHYVLFDGEGENNRYVKNGRYPGNYAVLGLQFQI